MKGKKQIEQRQIEEEFKKLGIKKGMTMIIHTSMKEIGYIIGGAQSYIDALENIMGLNEKEGGTLIMTTYSGQNSDPTQWKEPEAEQGIETRKHIPVYSRKKTPTRGMGKVPELFRQYPGTRRSMHPKLSFTAKGKHAKKIIDGHALDFALNKNSPLGNMVNMKDQETYICLVGVTHKANTSLHLAEYEAERATIIKEGASMMIQGQKHWIWYAERDITNEDFEEIGEAFERDYPEHVKRGVIGNAETMLIKQQPLIDYAIQYMVNHPLGKS
mmetsp:Transcript_6744/g.9800  ORF Transcript_6744/g.9800 Transcript_6744/m.9800 type:complete len:272 (-) Transcript_6744:972-1787(-)